MKYFILIFFISIFSSSFAEDVKINVNGYILEQTCNIKSSNLKKNVNFDNINTSMFPNIGSTSDSQKISIRFEKCSGNVNISYLFSGTPDENNPDLLKVIGKFGSYPDDLAKGIAIQILSYNKEQISLNKKISLNEKITSENFDLDFYLRYISTAPKVKSGDASSLLYLDIFYE